VKRLCHIMYIAEYVRKVSTEHLGVFDISLVFVFFNDVFN